eukprot:gene13328-14703_t
MVEENVAQYLIQLHALSGCDSVSGFFGHGKKAIINSAAKAGTDIQRLQELGSSLTCDNELSKGVVKFILRYVYKEKEEAKIYFARAKKWNSMKKKDTARLTPDQDSLYLHIRHANYQALIFRSYANASAPASPFEHGWVRNDQGYLEPTTSTTASIPENIMDIFTDSDEEEGSADDEYASSLQDEDSDEILSQSDESDFEEELI